MSHSRRLFCGQLWLATGAALVLTSGCATDSSSFASKLDPVTAVTITYSDVPLVFYRDQSGRAAHARNYIHLAPLEVNRSGSYRYYLWLGIWNTMLDAETNGPRDGFDSIIVFADGEPLSLDVAGWTAEAIGASEPVYSKPVASAADAYYEVTLDYLRFIAESKDIRLQSTGSQGASYEPWDEQKSARASLAAFLRNSGY